MRVERVTDPADVNLTALFEALWYELDALYGPNPDPPFQPSGVPQAEFFLVHRLDSAVGCAALVETEHDDILEVKRMFVRSRARGTGAASLLLEALATRATERGAERLRLETGTRQPRAIAFYEREGFEHCECWAPHTDDPLSRCFIKRLVSRRPSTTSS